ncbi:hypothetical protein B0H17DRAFT_1216909 [Mycena rosella]|uniref:Uncharacterized protein n=1 Tax=Mycena rosella TaxID=1033263 RepID=A0AAD7FQV7_MYCRO|nr:hypothetical protein B0H17DRAFT_1216909 [Mycena rosella]
MSGLAGVYFGMVLKNPRADLWVRIIQLSLFFIIPALLPVLYSSTAPPFPYVTTVSVWAREAFIRLSLELAVKPLRVPGCTGVNMYSPTGTDVLRLARLALSVELVSPAAEASDPMLIPLSMWPVTPPRQAHCGWVGRLACAAEDRHEGIQSVDRDRPHGSTPSR